jgi:DNA invertase Pin-like site-specific DNA recombinase
MTDQLTPAVIYAAKSTEDKHGSIPTQLEDGRTRAAREGWEVVAERQDEAISAYSADRGPGLAYAMALCEQLVAERGSATLIVQHSDRLARGDGKKARHLVEVALWALKHDVRLVSVQDPEMLGEGELALSLATIGGMRNNQDSKRKAESVHDGAERRRQRGQANGRVGVGYMLQPQMVNGTPVVEKGYVVNDRLADPVTSVILDEAFAMVENGGAGYGDVARALNARGVLTTRGNPWSRETVKYMLHNRIYLGEGGYPRLVSDARWQAVQDQPGRADPAPVQRRKGGRPSTDAFVLRGILFCGACGAPMWTRGTSAVVATSVAMRDATTACAPRPQSRPT